MLGLVVRHVYHVYDVCLIVHTLNVKKTRGEEDDYDTK